MLRVAAFHIENINSKCLSSIGIYLRDIYRFNQKNKKVSLMFLGPKDQTKGEISSIGLFPLLKNKGLIPISVKILLYLTLKIFYLKKFDALWFQHVIYVLPTLFLSKKTKVVLTIHGREGCNVSPYYGQPFKTFLVALAERIAIRKSARVIVLNREDLKYYRRKFPAQKDKFLLIPTFFDEHKFKFQNKEAAKKQLKLARKRVFIYTGRLVNSKGVNKSLEIFALYRRENRASIFLVIGNGDEKESLKNKAAGLGIKSAVKFISQLENAKLPVYYQAADIFIISSASEGLPISCLEAMACGTPVLAREAVGINELVQNGINGYLFSQEEDSHQLVNKIEKIFSDKKIGCSTKKSVEKFSSSAVCPKIINFLAQ